MGSLGTVGPIDKLDRVLAPLMFAATLVFLAALGIAAELIHQGVAEEQIYRALSVCLGLWPLYWLEFRVHQWRLRGQPRRQHQLPTLFVCLCPPLRLGARDFATGTHIWVPGLGWQTAGPHLYAKLERALSIPMVLLALAAIPVLVMELRWPHYVHASWALQFLVIASTVLIWMAFVVEFVLLCSLSDNKIAYIRTHWLDLLIILLPLVAFLRLTRLARLGRTARYLRLEQVGRLARTYSIRAMRTKLLRAVFLLNLLDRILRRHPRLRLERMRQELRRRERELQELRRQIEELERQLEAQGQASRAVDKSAVP
jgi:hypothetical protein